MNCEEVSKHLTEYLDKTLDTAMTTRVATHVISCALCRAESNELADVIQQVATLPPLDVPLGFAQRVMAHVHDMEPRLSLWQRLLLPVSKRVPLQATAVAVVSICAVALYQKEQQLKKNSDVNLALRYETQTPANEKQLIPASAAPMAALKDREIEAKKSTTNKVPTDAQKTAQKENSRAGSSEVAQSQSLKTTAATPVGSEPESSGEAQTVAAPKRPPLRVQEVTTARDSSMFGDLRGFSAPFPAPLGALRQADPRPIGIALERATHFGDRIADFEFIVRRRAAQRRDAAENLSNADAVQKASETENPAQGQSRPATPPARPRIESIGAIRFYNVAAEHFELFKKELAAESNIESEPKYTAKDLEAAKQSDRQLLVKVTILPAENPSNSR